MINYKPIKQCTVRDLIQSYDAIAREPLSSHIIHKSQFTQFFDKYAIRIQAAFDKIDALNKKYLKYENGKPLMEDVFQEKEIERKVKGIISDKTIKETVKEKTGTKPLFLLPEEDYKKEMDTIFNQVINL